MNGLKKVREEGNLKYDDEIKCPECEPGGQTREEDKLTSHIDEARAPNINHVYHSKVSHMAIIESS